MKIKTKKMSYKIISKYIKNIEFNIPNPKTFYLLSKEISNYKINININSNQIEKNIIEVETTLNLIPIKENFEKIKTNITYSTIIEIKEEINKEDIEKIILIEVPNKFYSEIRNIFIYLFENSGFKDIKISDKVDFKKLYELRKVQ